MNDEIVAGGGHGQINSKRVIITTEMNELAPILEVKTHECVTPLNGEDLETINQLKELLLEQWDTSYGIAAPQIGIPKRIFIMRDRRNQVRVFVNPVVIRASREASNKPEGCLSVKNFFPRVTRSKSITIQWFCPDKGNIQESIFQDMDARVIQHELDHLNGRLITYHGMLNLEKQFKHKMAIKNKRDQARTKRKAKR